jgi:hypothetical protein
MRSEVLMAFWVVTPYSPLGGYPGHQSVTAPRAGNIDGLLLVSAGG